MQCLSTELVKDNLKRISELIDKKLDLFEGDSMLAVVRNEDAEACFIATGSIEKDCLFPGKLKYEINCEPKCVKGETIKTRLTILQKNDTAPLDPSNP